MSITIEPLSPQNIAQAGQCEDGFTVDARLVLAAEDTIPRFTILPCAPYEKRYPAERVDYGEYLVDPDKALFLAYVDQALAGEVRLSRAWNQFAWVEWLAVEPGFRRRGVGRALLGAAEGWARARRLPGIRLETQDNNVAACRLYAAYGFQLGGFDRWLYRGLQPDTREAALYWYLIFDSAPEAAARGPE